MTDVDKLIADATAVMGGDTARIDVLMTRMTDIATNSADVIHGALRDDAPIRELHGINVLVGMAWLLGRMAALADHEAGNTRVASMTTLQLMIQGGYDEWLAGLDKST